MRAGEKRFRPKRLSKDETKALFTKLAEAAKSAKTFRARIRRSERTGFVLDAEPLVSEGRVWAARPDRFRQEMTAPRRSLAVINRTDLWIHFPESREAQHVDLARGISGRSGTTVESFMPWLEFDLEDIEKKYRVYVKTARVPEGVTIRRVERSSEGEAGSPGPKPEDAPLPVRRQTGARVPDKAYELTYVPRDAKQASNIARLSLTVVDENPWPIKIVKQTMGGDTITTWFFDVVLDAPLEPRLFEFTPPRGTKVEELSG